MCGINNVQLSAKAIHSEYYTRVTITEHNRDGACVRCTQCKSTVEKVGRHQQLQGYLWVYRELGYFCAAVGVANLVVEVHAHFTEDM